MSVTVPVPSVLPEGHHAFPHPRAGERIQIPLHGRTVGVTVKDWYDRVTGRTWKQDALAGEPAATQYANRLALLGLPDTNEAVMVVASGKPLIVHHRECR